MTKDNRKNPEYHIVIVIRKLRTDKRRPVEKSWPNHIKDELHSGSKNTHGPKSNEQSKHNDALRRTANENAADLLKICKRSDQPK